MNNSNDDAFEIVTEVFSHRLAQQEVLEDSLFKPGKYQGLTGDTVIINLYAHPDGDFGVIQSPCTSASTTLDIIFKKMNKFVHPSIKELIREQTPRTFIAPRGYEGMVHVTQAVDYSIHNNTSSHLFGGYRFCDFGSRHEFDGDSYLSSEDQFSLALPINGLTAVGIVELCNKRLGLRIDGDVISRMELVGMVQVNNDYPLKTPENIWMFRGDYLEVPVLKND